MSKQKIWEELQEFRKTLHRYPELSGEESQTASRVEEYLSRFGPDRIVSNIGGYGMAAEFSGREAGPTVMFRCELDGLPIPEKTDLLYRSVHSGKGHLCGHDGHMAMVAGLASVLQYERPAKGRVLLLFQPSEEDGQGAERVLHDPKFDGLQPDYIFAIHNLPGFPLNRIVIANGHFAAASRGMVIRLQGKSSHAAEPEHGINPANAMAKMISGLYDVMKIKNQFKDFTLITPIHARLGNLAYGTSPGEGVIHLTLRSYLDEDMETLMKILEQMVGEITRQEKLDHSIAYEEVFPATLNDYGCTQRVRKAGTKLEMEIEDLKHPFKWSEDFGHFTARYKGALFGLGSGVDQPALHNPDYDFPDELIPVGVGLYEKIYKDILNT